MAITTEADALRQLARVNKNLKRVADECEAEIFDTLFTQGALLAREIKSLAPVDPDSDTPGAARDSVRVEESTRKGRKAVFIKAGGPTTQKPTATGKGYYDYVRAIVFGTQHTQAFDFFFAPFRARKKEIRRAVAAAVKRAVRRVFK